MLLGPSSWYCHLLQFCGLPMYPWILWLILCSLCCQSSEFSCKITEYENDSRCCSLCKPGQWLLTDCTEHNETVCLPCNAGEFHDKYHRETSCLLHSECNEKLGFQMIKDGTSTSNVVCSCQLGKHCSSEACETCVRSTACGPGEGVIQKANRVSDTQCSPCQEGTYSDIESLTAECIHWSKCGDGHTIVQPGTSTTDVVCGPSASDKTWIYILLVFGCFVVIGLPAIIFMRLHRRKKKNEKKTEST
ncbi:tumor necrosis factor receptor superfamily member 5 isoform X2 [Eleutherodactylus coqui]|uniref:tumor necrosis factor receptor superfamily member 5 isoform X2 n=1 Tax=Eleutherodactylus coqui TaxID=57060 RepID=UPI0034620DF2